MQRVMIMFMPAKYQPDYIFLRHVPLRRVNIFTFIQIVCLACLWAIKTIKSISIIFPLMVRQGARDMGWEENGGRHSGREVREGKEG